MSRGDTAVVENRFTITSTDLGARVLVEVFVESIRTHRKNSLQELTVRLHWSIESTLEPALGNSFNR